MPKNTQTKKVNKKGETEAVLPVVEVELEESESAVAQELDPEIAAALTANKKKNKKVINDVDYIPEFERGDLDIYTQLPTEEY